VVVGTGIAGFAGSLLWSRALLALVVALSLQVGVNYANDYSDGIKGTDANRVGPVRLVGQGIAKPHAVRNAALIAFLVAAAAGLALVVVSGMWWLVGVGALAIVAAWTYTGGPRPYGYAGLGELFVFVFFGLVAGCGTVVTQVGQVSALAWMSGCAVGALACAILVANNLRDIPGDTLVGKRTLAVRIGDAATRRLWTALVAAALMVAVFAGSLGMAGVPGWPAFAFLGLVAVIPASRPWRALRSGALGRDLVVVLAGTGQTLLVYGLALGGGIAVS
jgi:1,4-dihydroxy-2-naphthoate octaprenyltransferase